MIYTGAQVYDNIFSKLIDIDTDGSFYGILATEWTAPDETTWVFDLVFNATFHNGEPFTPDDVVYTFERILDPATASAYSSLFDSIDSVTKSGDAQVTFTLKTPFGPFLTNLANNGQIVNQVAIEAGDPSRNPVGTGPFKFVEWVQGQHVRLEKNPDYFVEGKPAFDAVELRFLLVDQGRIDGLRSGELQWVDAVPLSQLETLSTDEAFNYVTSPTAGIPDFLAMNVTAAPFDQAEVRQAIAWALDRTAIRDIAYFGAGEVGLAEVPSGSTWFDDADVYAGGPDIERARELLAAAGITEEITVTYLGLPQYPSCSRPAKSSASSSRRSASTWRSNRSTCPCGSTATARVTTRSPRRTRSARSIPTTSTRSSSRPAPAPMPCSTPTQTSTR